jgi:hypothetical protein
VVAIPFINLRINPDQVRQLAPDTDHIWAVSHFVGTAHAVRRVTFNQLGGYDESLVNRGEERDYALRQLSAGYLTVMVNASPINHYVSEKRDYSIEFFYGARSGLRFCLHRLPIEWVMPYVVSWSLNSLKNAFFVVRRNRMDVIRGLMDGLVGGIRDINRRNPTSRRVFRLYEALRRNGPMLIEDAVKHLPGPAACDGR